MRIAGFMFLVLGILALIYSVYTMISNNTLGRGDNVPFMENGAPIIAIFCLLTAGTLLYVFREKRIK